MANSRFTYVRNYELPDPLLPGTFILFRIDGHAFKQFTEAHHFVKPNDSRGLELMDHAAIKLMTEFPDIILGFGQSDEYSFLLRKSAVVYNRRRSKITSILCSFFTASYVMNWPTYFPDNPLRYVPSFDARIVLYPGIREVRDYFSWRQSDTHVNNLYNTAFWALIYQGGQSKKDAHESLRGTDSSRKQDILYSQFKINYNALPLRFRKGTVLVREQLSNGEIESSEISPQDVPRTNSYGSLTSRTNSYASLTSSLGLISIGSTVGSTENGLASPTPHGNHKTRQESTRIASLHCDIIKDDFWNLRPYLLYNE